MRIPITSGRRYPQGHARPGERRPGVPEREDVLRPAERVDRAQRGPEEADNGQPEGQYRALQKVHGGPCLPRRPERDDRQSDLPAGQSRLNLKLIPSIASGVRFPPSAFIIPSPVAPRPRSSTTPSALPHWVQTISTRPTWPCCAKITRARTHRNAGNSSYREPPIHVSGQVFDHHPGSTMNTNETEYSLEPTTFHSMQEAQDLANTLTEPALGHSASPQR